MSASDKDKIRVKTSETERSPEQQSIHPICHSATDLDACEKFVERLEEAANNIDRRDS